MSVVFYHGVPFKFNKVIRDHSRFVHTVKFSPNGDLFASAGADGKVLGNNGIYSAFRKVARHLNSLVNFRSSCTTAKQVIKFKSLLLIKLILVVSLQLRGLHAVNIC
jgi:hypothetical protein